MKTTNPFIASVSDQSGEMVALEPNSQQTEGLTAEQEMALDALEILHTYARSGAELATSHNAEMDAHMRQIAALISRLNPPAQEAMKPALYQLELENGEIEHLSGVFGEVSEINGVKVVNRTALYTSPPDQSSLIKVLTEALETASMALYEASDKFHILSGYIKDEAVRQCAKEKVYEMANANIIARKALCMAKEGN